MIFFVSKRYVILAKLISILIRLVCPFPVSYRHFNVKYICHVFGELASTLQQPCCTVTLIWACKCYVVFLLISIEHVNKVISSTGQHGCAASRCGVRRPLAGKQKQRMANAGRQSNTAEAKMSSMERKSARLRPNWQVKDWNLYFFCISNLASDLPS